MRLTGQRSMRGFSILELLVAMAVGLVIIGGVVELFRDGTNVASVNKNRAEMQQNARVALNLMVQDGSMVGTGMPAGGIQLPSGAGSSNSKRGCSESTCGLWTYLADDRLYALTPGDGLGPTVGGVATDILTMVYRDENLALSQAPLVNITPSGNQITAQTGAVANVVTGDILMLCNANGCAVGAITNIASGDIINFASNDPLNINQPSAAFGNIAGLSSSPGVYPPTTAWRILVVTYFIDGTTERLMRQVNAHPPVPVAEVIENLQVSYDIFDDSTMSVTAALPGASGVPNQIRKINLSIHVRGPHKAIHNNQYDRLSLTTSVSVRNLSFRDRYL